MRLVDQLSAVACGAQLEALRAIQVSHSFNSLCVCNKCGVQENLEKQERVCMQAIF
jgi:hypothetical protein